MLVLLAVIAAISPSLPAAESSTPLADSMFGLGLYHAAATEYKRALFPLTEDQPVLHLKLGLSLGAAHDIEAATDALHRAAESFPKMSYAAGLALAGLFSKTQKPERSRLELLDLLILSRDSAQQTELNLCLAWLDLKQHNLDQAADYYTKAGRSPIASELRRIDILPRKNPSVAGLLSSIIPGAGETYAGRPVTGLLSLLVTGGSAAGTYWAASNDDWVTAAVLFSLLFLRFYNGSRRNAVDFTDDFNRIQVRRRVDRLLANGEHSTLSHSPPDTRHSAFLTDSWKPDWFGPAERLTGFTLTPILPASCYEPPGTTTEPVLPPSHHE